MTKDTEKLIRTLSLIMFFQVTRHPVTAFEVRRNVENYSAIAGDATFLRRFCSDRADLASLGIETKAHTADNGCFDTETYTLPAENFYLAAVEFSDDELSAAQAMVAALGKSFAYAAPLRVLMERLSPSKLAMERPGQTVLGGAIPRCRPALAKLDAAIARRKRVVLSYREARFEVDPFHLHFADEFYLVGRSCDDEQVRAFRFAHISDVAFATKKVHDFDDPAQFDPAEVLAGVPWQRGIPAGEAQIWLAGCVADEASASFESSRVDEGDDGGKVFDVFYTDSRQLRSWIRAFGPNARILGSQELLEEVRDGVARIAESHSTHFKPAARCKGKRSKWKGIQPDRLAQQVGLAGMLIDAAQDDRKLELSELCERLQVTEQELRHDIEVLNLTNFAQGCYILYAEVQGGLIDVRLDAYWECFARPMRLLPLEARALLGAVDLVSEQMGGEALASFRRKIVETLGDQLPRGLQILPAKRADRGALDEEGACPTTARVWISPELSQWALDSHRVIRELKDGAVIIELPQASLADVVELVLDQAGDAVVISPKEARQAILQAVSAMDAENGKGRTPDLMVELEPRTGDGRTTARSAPKESDRDASRLSSKQASPKS